MVLLPFSGDRIRLRVRYRHPSSPLSSSVGDLIVVHPHPLRRHPHHHRRRLVMVSADIVVLIGVVDAVVVGLGLAVFVIVDRLPG